jgi:DNA-binding transcriptional ArsR family regulator
VAKPNTKSRVPGPGSRVAARAAASPEKRGIPELDRVLHERMRLAIVSALAANATLTFLELRSLLDASDGNLSVHARKLEDAGYAACTKTFEGRVPKTTYRLTAEGRRALERYLSHLEAVIAHARGK